MRLVDHQQRRLRRRQLAAARRVGELLRGEEEELERVAGEVGERLRALGGGDLRVELRGAARLALGEVLHLVALERDQRRDHHRRARREQPGDLVDRRLARARRHHDERVAPGEHGLDGLALARAELVEAESLARHARDPVARYPPSGLASPPRRPEETRWVGARLGSPRRDEHTVERPPAALHRHRRRRDERAGAGRPLARRRGDRLGPLGRLALPGAAARPRRRARRRPRGRQRAARTPRSSSRARSRPTTPSSAAAPGELHRAELLGELTRAEADDRRRRHARQDDDVEHGRARAARLRDGPELPGRRHRALDRRQRRLGRRGSGSSSRPTSPTAACSSSSPRIAVLTNAELDHHATYASREEVDDTFRAFLGLAEQAVDLGPAGAARARRRRPRDAVRRARARSSTPPARASRSTASRSTLTVPGAHNARNAAAALTAARLAGADLAAAAAALGTFDGAGRRFERLGTTSAGALVVDDYAHHPTEVAATLEAARTLGARPRGRRLPAAPVLAHAARGPRVRRGAVGRRRGRRARRLPGARAGGGLPGRHRPAGRRRASSGPPVSLRADARGRRARICARRSAPATCC